MLIHLHIGIDKAGSSAIQSNMKINRDWFHKNSIFIPQTGLTNTGYWELFRELHDHGFSKLHDELRRSELYGFAQAFMSWEGINTYSIEQIETLKQHFINYDVKIYVYLREQSEIIQSGYFQQVKTGQQRYQLSDFYQNKSLLCPDFRDYASLLERFASAFGEDSIHVRVFDRSLLKQGNVVVDMLDMLKLEPDEDFQLSPDEDNPSLDLVSIKIMNLLDQSPHAKCWQTEQVAQRTASTTLPQRLLSFMRPIGSSPLEKQASSILDLYFGDIQSGREDIIDILLNIIDAEEGIGKYFLNADDCELIRQFYAESNRRVVEHFLGENWPHPELFPYVKPRVNNISAQTIDDALPGRLNAIAATGNHRTWNGIAIEGKGLGAVAKTEDGWDHSGESGAKSIGNCSTLRFRVDWKHINFMHNRLTLVIIGVPYGSYTSTQIYANGLDLGVHQLTRAHIEIPLSALGPLGLIDIEMEHLFATSDDSAANNQQPKDSGFILTALKYFRKM